MVLAVVAASLLPLGCGAGEGVSEDALVRVYAAAPLCAEAERELSEAGSRAGSVRVELRCLPPTRRGGRLDLTAIGANARRATQDSGSVAYIGEKEPAAARFSAPILAEAGIAQLSHVRGGPAMAELLEAIDEADSTDLRDALDDELG